MTKKIVSFYIDYRLPKTLKIIVLKEKGSTERFELYTKNYKSNFIQQ